MRAELKKICHFWADKGVDGLRLDVINLVSKDQRFPNDDQGDGRRFYTDGPRIHEFMQELSRDVFQERGLMTVGEMSSTSLQHCQQYANLHGTELSMTFNFHHLKVDYPNGEKWNYAKPDFIELKRIFHYWQTGMYGKAWNALFWCNHDQPRIVSRFGDEGTLRIVSAKLWAMILHGLQGTPYIYQGEEIGMTNPNFTSLNQYRDVESLNMYQELQNKGVPEALLLKILAQKSRDNSRTPMQWNQDKNAGFSEGESWIEVAGNYQQLNVQQALADRNSVFYCYQRLIALRKQYPIFTEGNYQDLLPESDSLWCYRRESEDSCLFVLANLTDKELLFNLDREMDITQYQILLNNYDEICCQTETIKLKPYQAIYLLR